MPSRTQAPAQAPTRPEPKHKAPTNAMYEFWVTDDGLAIIAGWARVGLADVDIANNCGVSKATFSRWRAKYPEIAKRIKENRGVANMRVVNAVYQRAVGYDYTETKTVAKIIDGKKVAETHTALKHVVPDVGAQAFWLKNQDKAHWKNSWDEKDMPGDVEDLTPLADLLKLEAGDE